jgi:hypothetical protein
MSTSLVRPPPGKLVVSYGGGVNSVATLALLKRLGLRPEAIVMADPGSERRKTLQYRDEVVQPWLASIGFPPVTVINRIEEGQYIKRAWRLETLRDECLRIKALPSIAYGWKKCSAKYKGDTQRWWVRRQKFAQESWKEVTVVEEHEVRTSLDDFLADVAALVAGSARQTDDEVREVLSVAAVLDDGTEGEVLAAPLPASKRGRRKRARVEVTGEKLVKVIGYDVDEMRRVKSAFQNPWESARFVPWYPLVEAKMGREDCVALIASEGLPPAWKSACVMCPSNTLAEWREVRVTDPEEFEMAVEMSRRAFPGLESPDVVGLMRCNPHGKRQLHVWVEGGYPDIPVEVPALPCGEREDDDLDQMPCECAL